jgi:hypothetical protein
VLCRLHRVLSPTSCSIAYLVLCGLFHAPSVCLTLHPSASCTVRPASPPHRPACLTPPAYLTLQRRLNDPSPVTPPSAGGIPAPHHHDGRIIDHSAWRGLKNKNPFIVYTTNEILSKHTLPPHQQKKAPHFGQTAINLYFCLPFRNPGFIPGTRRKGYWRGA